MQLITKGKTKDLYQNNDGTMTLKFKDTATGKDGIFDPGENQVGLNIDGFGCESLRLSLYFFEKLKEIGIPTHYIESDVAAATMKVLPVTVFGKGLEFICRVKADGSFVRRYGAYTRFGDTLDNLVEVTIKDDERKDPPINEETLRTLHIMDVCEYETCVNLAKKITDVVAGELKDKNLDLYDIKFEFGRYEDRIVLMDEISAGCMRAYKDGKQVPPMELSTLVLS